MSIVLPPISTPFTDKNGKITQAWYQFLFQETFFLNNLKASGLEFAALTAFPVSGMLANITDSTTAVWGATIAGGGVNNVLAWYNGTNWTVVGA